MLPTLFIFRAAAAVAVVVFDISPVIFGLSFIPKKENRRFLNIFLFPPNILISKLTGTQKKIIQWPARVVCDTAEDQSQ